MGPAARRGDLTQLDNTSRWALAALSLGGAFVHFAVMGEHFDVSVPHGVFFAVAAWLQLAFAFAVVMRPSRGVLRAGAIMNLAIISVWIVSRAFGTPFDPVPWTPEAANFPDVLATVFEGVSVLGCASLLSTRSTRRLSPAMGLPAVGVLAGAVVILSTLSLVPAVAGESHAHSASAAAAGHTHATGIEAANGSSPCEESGPSVSEGQSAGGHGERGPSSQVAITDASTRVTLGEELAVARTAALRFPSAADAQKAGYIRITPYLPCIGAHWIKPSIMDSTFDVDEPEMLLYDASNLDGRMVGLSYWAKTGVDTPPEGFAGPNDHWHQHIGLCVGPGGVLGNEATTEAQCARLGGKKTDGSDSWMVHVWVVPGWESAWGLFSGEHPELGVTVPR